jgi:thiamine kinase-like enzyme
MSATAGLLGTQLDPLRSPALQQELPGVKTAFDAEAMRGYLQAALFGKAHPNYLIERCEPGQSVYPGDCCIIRYQLEVKDSTHGQTLEPLVIGRVFPDQRTCAEYLRDRLAPLVEQMRGREEIAPFVTPVALIEPLNMVVYVFPIDGELPVLVEVTDRLRMREILGELLPDVLDNRLTIEDCQVELGHYGRQHRCVLRYHITGTAPGVDTPRHMLVYGKIAADGRGALAGPVIAALHERVLDNGGSQFNIPRSFGFRPDLQLALFEAIPGVPQVAQLLKARLKGAETTQPGKLTLEESLDACARIAAALHTSEITLGRPRTLEDEQDGLRQGFAIVQRISPALGAQFQTWLERAATYAADSKPLNLCFSHGDFSYTQLIFEGTQSGLVDFDTVCQAEPALDLGQFLAYLRVAVLKGQKAASPAPAALTEQLCAQFLNTYIAAAGDRLEDEERLRVRVPVYEIISLLRLALHSWQKLKGSRLEYVIAILEERVSCLPQLSY